MLALPGDTSTRILQISPSILVVDRGRRIEPTTTTSISAHPEAVNHFSQHHCTTSAMPDEEEQPFIDEKSEADGLHQRHSALLRSHRRLGRWTVASNVVLAAIVVALVVLRVTSHDGDHSPPVPTCKSRSHPFTQSSKPQQIDKLLVPTKRVLFEQDELFAGELSAENDAAWGSLNPVSYLQHRP